MVRVLIILGGGIKDNKLNEPTLIRFKRAIEIEKNYDYIICSSDRTYRKQGKLHVKSEAQIGCDYLVENNVDKNKIILEEKSRDTFSNAFYCRLITDKFKYYNLDILTSAFHIDKTRYLFEYTFPKEEYNLKFIAVDNPNVDLVSLNNRIISENEVLKFYKKHLFDSYGVVKYDLDSIKYFLDNYNFATSGNKDELQEELTNLVKSKILSNKLFY